MLVHFAHANGIPGASYQPVFDRIQPHQGFAIPRLGHNPQYPFTHNWRYLVNELVAYIEQNASEPIVGVGHSLGSILTFMCACKRPDLFRGVLMLDPPLLWGKMAWMFKLMKLIGREDDVTPAGKSKHRRRSWSSRDAAVEYFRSKRLFQFHPDCFEAFINAAIAPGEGETAKLFFDVDVELGIFRNTPDNLKSYNKPDNLPFRLVYADKSDASRPSEILPFCKYFGIPSEKIAGEHMYPLQQPDLTAQLILRFIEECH